MLHSTISSSIALARLMNSARDAAPMTSGANSSLVPPLSHVTLALLRKSSAQRPARRCGSTRRRSLSPHPSGHRETPSVRIHGVIVCRSVVAMSVCV